MDTRQIKVLVVDDNSDNLIAFRALLRDSFPSSCVFTAETGQEGIRLAQQEDPDVLLLDVVMPGMDGFEVCKIIKADQALCDIPVVFVTASKGDKENRIQALECGAEAFLSKPVDISELTAQIRAMVKIKDANVVKRNEQARLSSMVEEKIHELKLSEERYKSLFEYSGVCIAYFTTEGEIISLNRRSLETLGGTPEKYIGKSVAELFTKEFADRVLTRIHKAVLSEKSLEFENQILPVEGARWIAGTYSRVMDSDGKVAGVQVVLMDTTERKKAEEKLIYLSYHDHLTGLYNRRFFEEELQRFNTEINLPITIILCDINGLKLINDSMGHHVGDDLLIKAAAVFRKVRRSKDCIARIGGDEFALLLPNTDMPEAIQMIEHIKQLASMEKIGGIDLSISFGYKTKHNKNEKITDTLANAENHMYKQKIYDSKSMRSNTINLIMNTLFEKSKREMMHSKRVSELCEAIAVRMNLHKDDVNQIRIAGLMHDIGKIGIDEQILNCPGKLSDAEWEEMKKHPEGSWRILSSVEEFSELAIFVLHHHERWAGGGYPNGIQGEEIPIESRIISVADAYDAMTCDRTYRKALNEEAAKNEILKYSGTQFDPAIVNIFIEQVLPR